MKISHNVFDFPICVVHLVERLDIGGLERAVQTIVKNLDKYKYRVEVWCLVSGGAIADEIVVQGIRLRILRLSNYYNIGNIFKLSYYLHQKKVKILHTHGYFASTFGRLAAFLSNVPVIITHVQTSHRKRKKRHILINRALSYITDMIVACSEAAKNFLIDVEGISSNKVMTIHNAVDLNRFNNIDPCEINKLKFELGLSSQNRVVGTIGRLDPVKGHIYLLEAATKVIEEFPNVKFILIGDGPLANKLKSKISEMGIDNYIIFCGERTDVPLLLPIFDIFVLPSATREGLPNVIPEAEACEKPVVASRIGGVPEAVLDQITGFLVTPGRPDEIADKILYLLRNPDVAILMGQKGKSFCAEHFSSSRMLEKTEALYIGLLSKKVLNCKQN